MDREATVSAAEQPPQPAVPAARTDGARIDGARTDGARNGESVLTGEPDGLLSLIRNQLPEFTGALRRVADHVLTDPASAARSTIVELAERSGTSPATVTR